MNNLTVVTIAFLILLFGFFLNPFYLWMPVGLEYLMISALVVIAAVFAGLVLGEKPRDEREEQIRDASARAGYIAGVAILTLSIVITVLNGNRINEWVTITLAVMVLVRIFARSRER